MAFEYCWETRWRRCGPDERGAEWDRNLDFLGRLGAQGWQLVGIAPRRSASDAGCADCTDSELWVFVRRVEAGAEPGGPGRSTSCDDRHLGAGHDANRP